MANLEAYGMKLHLQYSLEQDQNIISHFAIECYIVKQRCLLPDGLMQKKPYHPTTTKMQIFARHIYSRKELLHACNLMAHVSISFFRGFFFATQKILTTHTSLFIFEVCSPPPSNMYKTQFKKIS